MREKLFVSKLLLTSVLLTINVGCIKKSKGNGNGSEMLQKAYVNRVYITTGAEALTVEVLGNLPSPAYTFERFDVKKEENVITVTPLATYDPSVIAADVLIPFEESYRIENLAAGTYELKVLGADNFEITREVAVDEQVSALMKSNDFKGSRD